MTLKLITLDLDNTLWETDPVVERAERACFDWLVENHPGVADLYTQDSLRQYKSDLAECYPSMAHEMTRLRIETMRRVLMQTGLDRVDSLAESHKAFEVFYAARSTLELFEGAQDALEWLDSHYPLIALTNGNADLERIGIRHLFVEHYNAEQVGAAKPAADLFEAALSHQQVEAHQCLHIGDHPWQDIDAAAKLGFHTLWVNVLGMEWPQELPPPSCTITHLSQLKPVVEKLMANLS